MTESAAGIYNCEISSEELDSYELKIITKGCVPCIIHAYIRKKKDSNYLCYNVKAPRILTKLKDTDSFTIEPFSYIKQIIKSLNIMKKYLLNVDKIVISSEYIFFDNDDESIRFMYDLCIKSTLSETMKKFLEDVLEHMDLSRKRDFKYVNDIYEIVCEYKDTSILLKALYDYIEKIKENQFIDFSLKEHYGDSEWEISISDNNHVYIGRSIKNDICIGDITVSSLHAVIISKKKCLFISDLDSTNGTYINHIRVASDKYVLLKDKDVLGFAGQEYVINII